ncbi:ABC transporter ATP-binding protein [Candidatus Omnitrophota bacterium]
MNNVLEIHALTKVFWRDKLSSPFTRGNPQITALDGIDLVIETPGDMVRVSGPNGSGKTTLLKCISGLLIPTRGSIRIFEKDAQTFDLKKRIGMLTDQERSFYWRLSGRNNIRFFAGLYGMDRRETDDRMQRLADTLDISPLLDTPFSQYSTGIRQRFSIMRAFIHEPSLLLLDEPQRSLDQTARERLWHLLDDLSSKKGVTVIYTTHESDATKLKESRHLRLDKGRVVS